LVANKKEAAMPGPSRAIHYRERAAELRQTVAGLAPHLPRTELLLLAEQYDRLADDIENWGREFLAAETAALTEALAGKDREH
jgi:hypothetical protein